MEINSLIKKQVVLTGANQQEWQRIVKTAVLKYGTGDKAKKQIQKDLKKFADKLTKDALKLGLKWLE